MRDVQRHRQGIERRLFIPDIIWVYPDDGSQLRPVHRADEPGAWEAAVDSDDPVVVQVGDGGGKWGMRFPTSSSTARWLMGRMIDALQIEPGMRVLEIGTGTGYNAALLADAGATVTSVEIDPGLADHARRALEHAGFCGAVSVVVGDGEAGCVEHAPYDRVIATAAAHTIPYSWVEQTREGGRIVAPYTGPHHRGALAILTVQGGVADGTLAGEAAFMPLRGQRLKQAELQAIGKAETGLRIQVGKDGQRIWLDDPQAAL